MKQKFYICAHCGNIIAMIRDCGVSVWCCGEKMQPIQPGVTEGAGKKHIPLSEVDGSTISVQVGAAAHPMEPEHYIEWICLETKQGVQYKVLEPNHKPTACFRLCDGDEVQAVYAFCNRHSLWKG